jgi:hypothetical protein
MKFRRLNAPPKVKRVGRIGILQEDYYFLWMGHWFCIRAGFRFDGASIPRPFWWVVARPFTAWVIEAALVHDHLYRCHALYECLIEDGAGNYRQLTRREMDRAFLAVMLHVIDESGKGRVWRARRKGRARSMYLAVRKAGWAFMGDGSGREPRNVRG